MLAAKVFFIVTGLVQQTLLPAVIGLAGYGALARVLAVANIVNNVVVSSATQGVSRTVARAQSMDAQALRATLRVHAPVAVAVASAFFLAAPGIAAFEHAPCILQPLRVMAAVALLYGLYAPLIGALNGRKQFTRQASLDITFAVLRTAGLVGLGFVFARRGLDGVTGSTFGIVVAAVLIVPIALRWTGMGRAYTGTHAEIPTARAYLAGLAPLAIAQLATNLLMQVDITLLGRFLSLSVPGRVDVDVCVGAVAQTNLADEWVGVYRACQLFAFLPYQLLFSVTQVLFPMVASAQAEGDRERVAALVRRGSRLALIICGLLVCVVLALPESLLYFAYGKTVAERGAPTLRLLALGQAAFALLGLANTVLVSLGKERRAALISTIAFVIVAVACWFAIPNAEFGAGQLRATAIASAGALTLAFIGAGLEVRKSAGSFIPAMTMVRVGAALGLALAAGTHLPRFGRLVTPVVACGVVLAYVVFLLATRELGVEDVAALRAVVRRRAKR